MNSDHDHMHYCAEMERVRRKEILETVTTLGAELKRDGNQWWYHCYPPCPEGVDGFGDTPFKAAEDFFKSYNEQIIPVFKKRGGA